MGFELGQKTEIEELAHAVREVVRKPCCNGTWGERLSANCYVRVTSDVSLSLCKDVMDARSHAVGTTFRCDGSKVILSCGKSKGNPGTEPVGLGNKRMRITLREQFWRHSSAEIAHAP